MNSGTAHYLSPIGALEIRSMDGFISQLLFVNTDKKQKLDESVLSLEGPVSEIIGECKVQLQQYFDGKRLHFDLPIQQSGTLFQQRVWSALCAIPYGRTISYMELSKRIGDTKAIRAVGKANGSNNIAIIVPCHRVIGSNADLVGYAGDLWRKQWLLEHEGKVANGVQTLF